MALPMCACGSVLTLGGCCCTLGTVQIAFYRRVADPKSSFYGLMPVPKPIVTRYNRPFHRVLLVLELVPAPFATIPDWEGANPVVMQALLKDLAPLHARYWRLPANLKDDMAFMYDQQGLSYLGMVRAHHLEGRGARVVGWYALRLWPARRGWLVVCSEVVAHSGRRTGHKRGW